MPRRGAKSFRPIARRSIGWWRGIRENGGGENAPRPGDAMPPFMLPDETGRLVELAVAPRRRTACRDVLPRSLVPVLQTERDGRQSAFDRIKASGGQVVAIMPEVQEFAEKFKYDADLPFPVLTDSITATRYR